MIHEPAVDLRGRCKVWSRDWSAAVDRASPDDIHKFAVNYQGRTPLFDVDLNFEKKMETIDES